MWSCALAFFAIAVFSAFFGLSGVAETAVSIGKLLLLAGFLVVARDMLGALAKSRAR